MVITEDFWHALDNQLPIHSRQFGLYKFLQTLSHVTYYIPKKNTGSHVHGAAAIRHRTRKQGCATERKGVTLPSNTII